MPRLGQPHGGPLRDLTGNRYRNFVVVGFAGWKKGRSAWRSRCDCGHEKIVDGQYLQKLDQRRPYPCGGPRCTFTNPRRVDHTGKRFDRLAVTRYLGDSKWECRCDCGAVVTAEGGDLTRGLRKSCGCSRGESNTKHGAKKQSGADPLAKHAFHVWCSVKQRCTNRNTKSFKNYGGRGVKMHDVWADRNGFPAFLAGVGLPPSVRHQLDRFPNNDGNYEPGNVRWATQTENQRNKRTNRRLTYNGETRSLAAWAEATGVPASTLRVRIDVLGWPIDRALSTPPVRSAMRARRWVPHPCA